jgi:uncharacterized protein YybS (DUF2232 family)
MPEPLPSQEIDDFISTPREPPPNARHLIAGPLVMVETAFLASTTALVWLVSVYVPVGPLLPLLRTFFPISVALAYLRWGRRAAWMTAFVTALLVAVLLGPPRSVQFLIPYGCLGVLLGGLWRRRAGWSLSMGWGTLIMAVGLCFQLGFLSLMLGTNLWLYLNRQVLSLLDWVFLKLGILVEPDLAVVQLVAVGLLLANATLYMLLVHLIAWMLLERLGSPIPNPPRWLQVLLDYQEE